jgi:hypothetical protein
VTVFRPSARVTSPDGREWEIYAYKINVRDRETWDVDDPVTSAPAEEVAWVISGVLWVVMLIPRLLLRMVDVAVGAVRMLGSDEWTIDAVTYMPPQTVHTWTTTSEYKGQVLAQVEGHLARGDVAIRLTHAVYRGEDSRSAR